MFDYRRSARRRWLASLATTLLVAAVRAAGAVATGSGALLGGALQAGGDGISQCVLAATGRHGPGARGLHFARHPLAQERQRYFWPLALGALLAGLGAGVAVAVAGARLGHPPGVPRAYSLVAASIAVATTLWKAAPAVSASWWHDLAQLRQPRRPEIALVTLQDALSAVGGMVVTVAVTATALTGDPVFDTAGTLVVGVIMATGGVLQLLLLRRTVVGRGASRTEQQGITAAIEIEPSVLRLAQLDSYQVSPDELLVAANVELVQGLELAEVSETVQRLKASVRRAVPAVRALYLESDTSGSVRIEPETVDAQLIPEIRPSGSDFERGSVTIARETDSYGSSGDGGSSSRTAGSVPVDNRTPQEGKPWQSA